MIFDNQAQKDILCALVTSEKVTVPASHVLEFAKVVEAVLNGRVRGQETAVESPGASFLQIESRE